MQHIYSKSESLLVQHNVIMNCSFSYHKNIFFYCTWNQKKTNVRRSHFRNTIFLIVTVIITEKFNVHFRRIAWLVTTWSSSSIVRLTLSVLHFFIADVGSKFSELPPSSIILKIFSKRLITRQQRKLVLTCFN